MLSFRLQLLVILVAATAAQGAGPHDAARRVAFLLDRSGSMPRHPYSQGFVGEVAEAKGAAATILNEVDRFSETSVSFHTFGNKDSLQPFRSDTVDMSPSEAKGRLNEYFSVDPGYYSHHRTYIAYSIFNLVKQQLGLGADFGPERDIPEDVPPLNVFVFTDGGEDNDQGFDNGPYERWLHRQTENRLQVRWQTWKFFANGDERTKRDDIFKALPADSVTYEVHFGVPTTAYSFSNVEPPAKRTVNLEVPRLIRLIPAILGESRNDAEVCSSKPAWTDSAARDLLVQAQIQWPHSNAATSEWTMAAPERKFVERTTPDHAAPVHEVDRHVLYLRLAQTTPAVLDVSSPPGRYPVRLIRESLCEQLQQDYPSSKFVFPIGDIPNALPPLGFVTVENVPVYTFAIAAQHASRPNDALTPVVSDRWHLYATSSRTLRVTGPPEINAVIDVTVLVRQGGKSLPQLTDFVSVRGKRASGGAVTVGAGENFTVQVPARGQEWLPSLIEAGFQRPPGDYDVVLRVRPRVVGAAAARYKIRFVCENCDPARFAISEGCGLLTVPVRIEARPWSWIVIAGIVLAILAVLWVLIRWFARPQFREGFVIGNLQEFADFRCAHSDGFKGKLAVYRRQPLYIDLRRGGQTMAMIDPLVDHDASTQRTVLGLLPKKDRVYMWCVLKSGKNLKIEFRGDRYEPIGGLVPSVDNDKSHQLLYDELRDPAQLTVSDPNSIVGSYSVVSLS